MKKDPMFDADFLRQLDEQHLREVYAKVVALDQDENPKSEITGVVTAGTVNIDGKSAVRRTCNITVTTNMAQYKANLDWALRTKFKLYIGLRNFINPEYDDIIYFKMGIFVLTSYTTQFNLTGFTINIQGRDKMCLLNGDVSGTLMAETDFGTIWEEDPGTGIYNKKDIPIKTIIRDAVHEYAQESLSNIIINDLNTCGVELLEYRAKGNPLYVYESYDPSKNNIYQSFCFEQSDYGQKFASNPEFWSGAVGQGKWIGDGHKMTIEKGIELTVLKRADFGETVGFRATDLTYAGDLIANVGESVTSIFDKIVKMLGEFEYFYDIDGHFIFQRKKTYYNTTFTNAKVSSELNGYTGAEYYYDSTVNTSAEAYSFYGGNLIESYANAPKLDAIKNDYSVWGVVKSNKTELPIHTRCAIDFKPEYYYSDFQYYLDHSEHKDLIKDFKTVLYDGTVQERIAADTGQSNGIYLYSSHIFDWRELIYQMARDALDMRGLIVDITTKLEKSVLNEMMSKDTYDNYTAILEDVRVMYEKNLALGYQPYYSDILGFWRLLYSPYQKFVYQYDEKGQLKLDSDGKPLVDEDQSMSQVEWGRWSNNKFWNPDAVRANLTTEVTNSITGKVESITDIEIIDPTQIIFWFDFLDPKSGLFDYSVARIGRRTKVVNDNTVKSIFVRETPNVLFIDANTEPVLYEYDLHYTRMNMPSAYANYLTMSSQGKSAKEVLDNIIYDSTYYQDTITLNAIPVYYLEPNTRIKVYDKATGIDGDYIINSLLYSISHDGMMSIKASKAEKRIL